MKRHLLLAATAFVLLSPANFANAQDTTQTPAAQAAMQVTDAEQFMLMAAMSDMFEIQSSQLALENAQSDAVKQFAQQMIADHTANTQKLMQVVEAGGGKMEAPSKLDERHEQMVDQLQDASDEQFDAMYLEGQVQAHQEAVALMTGYSQNGDNEALQKFAAQALPVVQMHYEMVQKMAHGNM